MTRSRLVSSTRCPTAIRRPQPFGASVVPLTAPAPGETPTPNRNEPESVCPSTRLTVVQSTSYTPGCPDVRSTTIPSSPMTLPATDDPSGVRTATCDRRALTGSENVTLT